MASWRVAKCLMVLLREVDAMAPARSRLSDGTIGNAAHASRFSDHNPWVKDGSEGVVTARDITHDPGDGCDAGKLAEHFRALGKAGDRRVKYVIWNRHIAGPIENWRWREYDGPNPHTHHVHLSVSSTRRHYDSTKPWGLAPEVKSKPAQPDQPDSVKPPNEEDDMPTVKEIVDGLLTATVGSWLDRDGNHRFDEVPIKTALGAAYTDAYEANRKTTEALTRLAALEEKVDELSRPVPPAA